MAKNRSKEFGLMDEDERRKFEMLDPEDTGSHGELDLPGDDVRDPDRMGRHYADPAEEFADPESRDGAAAQLDEAAHRKRVRQSNRKPS